MPREQSQRGTDARPETGPKRQPHTAPCGAAQRRTARLRAGRVRRPRRAAGRRSEATRPVRAPRLPVPGAGRASATPGRPGAGTVNQSNAEQTLRRPGRATPVARSRRRGTVLHSGRAQSQAPSARRSAARPAPPSRSSVSNTVNVVALENAVAPVFFLPSRRLKFNRRPANVSTRRESEQRYSRITANWSSQS